MINHRSLFLWGPLKVGNTSYTHKEKQQPEDGVQINCVY